MFHIEPAHARQCSNVIWHCSRLIAAFNFVTAAFSSSIFSSESSYLPITKMANTNRTAGIRVTSQRMPCSLSRLEAHPGQHQSGDDTAKRHSCLHEDADECIHDTCHTTA